MDKPMIAPLKKPTIEPAPRPGISPPKKPKLEKLDKCKPLGGGHELCSKD